VVDLVGGVGVKLFSQHLDLLLKFDDEQGADQRDMVAFRES
jgi:hypothetical protein